MEKFDKNRRPKEPVLVIEDREENQALIQGILKSLHIKSQVAENGQVALDLMKTNSFSIYIVDLMMPIMDGKEFISRLKQIDPEAIILVQTAIDNTETIIEIMKKGVYDYIIKPLDIDHFSFVVSKALEYKYLKEIEKYIQKIESQKLQGKIEWLNYKELLRKDGRNSGETTSIENLKTSLSQGSGFGAMTTIVDMIEKSAKPSPDNSDYVEINNELMDILYTNNNITKNMLKGLSYVSDLLESKMDLLELNGCDLVDKLPVFCEALKPFLPNKKIKINYPKLNSTCMVRVDLESLQLAFEEMAINAFKYSKENSKIDIFAHVNNGYLVLSIKNEIRNDAYGGIPEDKEALVTLPFYRLHPPDESVSSIEKFGLGLGLTMVENIISKHNGLFFIHNVKDHTTENISFCVLAEAFIPIV